MGMFYWRPISALTGPDAQILGDGTDGWGTHVRAETDDPCESELGSLETFFLCDSVELIHDSEVIVECLSLESRDHLLERSFGDILW